MTYFYGCVHSPITLINSTTKQMVQNYIRIRSHWVVPLSPESEEFLLQLLYNHSGGNRAARDSGNPIVTLSHVLVIVLMYQLGLEMINNIH